MPSMSAFRIRRPPDARNQLVTSHPTGTCSALHPHLKQYGTSHPHGLTQHNCIGIPNQGGELRHLAADAWP